MGTLQGRPLSAPPPLLTLAGLSKRFGAIVALDDVALSVQPGEIFVLLGGSGSGKTTLLRCVGGFERPDAGKILLDGADITGLPPHRRPVNTMFQSYALFPHMSVAANIGFGLREAGRTRADIAARVAALLDLVQLPGMGARRPDQLSGGQRQRVALARALAREPRLLLLDEPLSALDRGLRERTREELVAVQRRLGASFVLVTHDQEEALAMATRIGVMHAGRLLQVGTPAEVYESPATCFVASFLGAANIFPAVVRETGRAGTLLELPGIGSVRARRPSPRQVGERVFLAVRPERVAIGAAAANVLPATLRDVSYRGDAAICALTLANGDPVRASRPLRSGAAGLSAIAPGPAEISFHPDACILLAE